MWIIISALYSVENLEGITSPCKLRKQNVLKNSKSASLHKTMNNCLNSEYISSWYKTWQIFWREHFTNTLSSSWTLAYSYEQFTTRGVVKFTRHFTPSSSHHLCPLPAWEIVPYLKWIFPSYMVLTMLLDFANCAIT